MHVKARAGLQERLTSLSCNAFSNTMPGDIIRALCLLAHASNSAVPLDRTAQVHTFRRPEISFIVVEEDGTDVTKLGHPSRDQCWFRLAKIVEVAVMVSKIL